MAHQLIRNILSIVLVVFLLISGFTFYGNSYFNSDKASQILIEQSFELEEVVVNFIKTTKRTAEKDLEYNLSIELASTVFVKGNSSFYIHNQLLPKILTTQKLNSTFFTTRFSTAV